MCSITVLSSTTTYFSDMLIKGRRLSCLNVMGMRYVQAMLKAEAEAVRAGVILDQAAGDESDIDVEILDADPQAPHPKQVAFEVMSQALIALYAVWAR